MLEHQLGETTTCCTWRRCSDDCGAIGVAAERIAELERQHAELEWRYTEQERLVGEVVQREAAGETGCERSDSSGG